MPNQLSRGHAQTLIAVILTLAATRPCSGITLPPVWESAFGSPLISSNLAASDKSVNLPFSFVLFGETYTSASVSSKGYVTFGGNAGAQPTPGSPQFVQGIPRIAPAWYDIDVVNSGGTIFFNSFDHRAVFTFLDVGSYAPPPGFSPEASNLATFQLQIYDDGTIVFGYAAFNSLDPNVTGEVNTLLGSPLALAGITPGFGGTDPGSTDLQSAIESAPGFAYTTANSTIYQKIMNDPATGTNFAGLNLIFTPNQVTGWVITATPDAAALTGAPEPNTGWFAGFAGAVILLGRSTLKRLARRVDG